MGHESDEFMTFFYRYCIFTLHVSFVLVHDMLRFHNDLHRISGGMIRGGIID